MSNMTTMERLPRMSSMTTTEILHRARRGLGWRVRRIRDSIEWRTSRQLLGRSPWCRNRWGHRYQAMSLAEYHYLRNGNPETHEALLLEQLLLPGMTVVDVGANHGLFSLEAAHAIGSRGRIFAFEPAPATRSLLERNLRCNGLDRQVQVIALALGEGQGTARLRVHHDLTGLNTLAESDITWNHRTLPADEVVEVQVTTLDDFARTRGIDRIDFLKIDVEGFELSVLRGARWLLSKRRIGWIMLEVGDVTCANAGVRPDAIIGFLDQVGHSLFRITPEGRIGSRVRAFPKESFAANFLAAPDQFSRG